MALQTAAYLSGKIDNVVFYKRAGTYIARSVPLEIKQTAATKIRSRNFGTAASIGRILRSLLIPSLPFPKDKRMQSKFSGAFAQWFKLSDLQSLQPANPIPFVGDFDFNDSTSVAERWKLPLAVTQPSANLMEVYIPAFIPSAVITAPAYTDRIECVITVASCRLVTAEAMGSATVTISIPYNDVLVEAQNLSLPVPVEPGCVVITVASISYWLNDQQKDLRPAFLPSSVIDARYC